MRHLVEYKKHFSFFLLVWLMYSCKPSSEKANENSQELKLSKNEKRLVDLAKKYLHFEYKTGIDSIIVEQFDDYNLYEIIRKGDSLKPTLILYNDSISWLVYSLNDRPIDKIYIFDKKEELDVIKSYKEFENRMLNEWIEYVNGGIIDDSSFYFTVPDLKLRMNFGDIKNKTFKGKLSSYKGYEKFGIDIKVLQKTKNGQVTLSTILFPKNEISFQLNTSDSAIIDNTIKLFIDVSFYPPDLAKTKGIRVWTIYKTILISHK
jgi:hypothetical protein